MTIKDIVQQRILILDGAMGTMIQRYHLTEQDFRGEEFAAHPVNLEGNNDILTLTRPDVISAIHRQYLEAGADIIESCSFNSQRISQAEYQTTDLVRRLNLAAARIARSEADRMTALTPDKPRFVAGSVGPTGKTASMSPDVDNPAFRAIDFDSLREAYTEQIEALVEGGVDIILIETLFDTLNAKAALTAAEEVFLLSGRRLPVMLSVTIADSCGRMLAGQTLEAFICSVAHFRPFSIGLNCSFGAEQMLPHIKQIAAIAPCYVSAYPNAGIPDQMGQYDQTPETMARHIQRFTELELVNIVGGCCGSTPDHIHAIAEAVADATPHSIGEGQIAWLAGLEGFKPNGSFINVGERGNVAGSRKFLRLINEGNYEEALTIARKQVSDGAMILDINMDDAMLDTQKEMCHFLNLMASDPDIARIPWMIDSSRFEVIEAALKCIQGKAIVNSLSLKEGEELFLSRAQLIKQAGAALVVMAFDEQGQATSYERRIEICERAYHLLTERIDFPAEDIIFDPNILTIATGMHEHDSYALDFIRATEWIHNNLPQAKVSGGVSNLSFSLRGNNFLREAMHAVFLYHAIRAGMDMAIVNPSTAVMYEDIPKELLEVLEDVILCRKEDATESLISLAESYRSQPAKFTPTAEDRQQTPLAERLGQALQRGDNEFLQQDIEEALATYPTPASIIEGPLMQGMATVGQLFGQGKMFLPQVVKSARTMKRAVEILQPHIEAAQSLASSTKAGRYLLATVKGDVHDIGKNIVGVVLACNNFEVIDLGVMVEAEQIVKAAKEHNVDFIGLSGLITPSLDEMCHVARELKAAGITAPLFIGGATTSPQHTAIKIASLYDGAVFHVKDAAQNPILAMQLLSSEREEIIQAHQAQQADIRKAQCATTEASQPIRPQIDWTTQKIVKPSFTGVRTISDISISDVRELINWTHFFNLWRVNPPSAEAKELLSEAEAMLDELESRHHLVARVGLFRAFSTNGSIHLNHSQGCPCCAGVERTTEILTPRQPKPNDEGVTLSLCDFVAPEGIEDYAGAFAVTIPQALVEELEHAKLCDSEGSLMLQSLCDRLVEAASEWLHREVRRNLWGYAPEERLSAKELFQAKYEGIRPAIGYPSLPDQQTIFPVARLLDIEQIGIRLTENGAMYPQSSVCGLYIANENAKYFVI